VEKAQGLKPNFNSDVTARVNSCPVTHRFRTDQYVATLWCKRLEFRRIESGECGKEI
jgi:hypothetical protein